MTSESNSRVRLYLIRHAQSEANLSKAVICGQNIPCVLTPLGIQQATLLGKRLKYQNLRFDYLICSSAIRAKQTAEIALQLINVDPNQLMITEALLEQSQGSWEGLNRDECYTNEVLQHVKNLHIEFSAPNGESIRMVQKRAITYLEPIIKQAKQRSIDENREISIGIFTHAGTIRSILQFYLESNASITWLIGQHNTAITELLFNQHGISLIKSNDYGHLTFLIPDLVD